MNYALVLSFSALLLSVFTLISTIPCAREKSSRDEKLVFNHSTGSFFVKPKELISKDPTGSNVFSVKMLERENGMPVGDHPPAPVPVLEVTGIENMGSEKMTINGTGCVGFAIDEIKAENKKLVLLDHMIAESGSLAISPYVPPTYLAISCDTGKFIKIYFDGRVEIPDGISLPDAAKMFWNALGISYPEFKQAIISQHEKEKKE